MIEAPACPYGYTVEQLHRILGEHEPAFRKWMRGQTMTLCDGRSYNHATGMYEASECAESPHGAIVYECDLRRFLAGLAPLD